MILTILISPATAISDTNQHVIVTTYVSEVIINADSAVQRIGFTVDGIPNVNRVPVAPGNFVVISLLSLPNGKVLETSIQGTAEQELTEYSVKISNIRSNQVYLTLSLDDSSEPVTPPTPDNPPSGDEPDYPDTPDYPYTPDTPSEPENPPSDEPGTDEPTKPDNPPVNPDTPGTDTPGSDEPGSDDPYRPILPPADSVYNLAGFIPIGAGALLLFLVFFWRRKVYRILKAHAKKHGEKPEKEHLKEIADAIIKLVKDDEKYPEWKKNNDVMRRLGVGICELLDEMNYPKIVPREALATEILKAAKGRLNRHRL